MEVDEEAVNEFIEISGRDRRTALYFLHRRNGNINNAIDEYFNNPDLPIPDDFMRETTSSDSYSDNNSSSSSNRFHFSSDESQSRSNHRSTNNSNSESDNSDNNDNNDLDSQKESNESINSTDLQPIVQIQVDEINSTALIPTNSINFNEKEKDEEAISNIEPFPKQKSKGASGKIFVYSNGVLIFDKFYEKSGNEEYDRIMKCLSSGFLPSDLVSNYLVDIEISNLKSQVYSK